MRKLRKSVIVCSVIAMVLAVVGIVGRVNALTDEELIEYSLYDIMFYKQCGTGGGSSECGITVTGSTIEEKIWSGLTSFMSEEQAAGVMGSMANESGFSPARHETTFLNSSPNFAITTNTSDSYGIGLIQWSYGRRVKVLEVIKEKASALLDKYIDGGRKEYGGLSGSDFLSKAGDEDTNTLIALELCYLKQELESNDTYGGLLKTKSVSEASDYFVEYVEAPADIPGQQAARRPKAQSYYDQFHGQTITGTSSSGGDGSGDPCNACSEGSKNINGTAVCLAWPLGTEKDVWKYVGSAYLKGDSWTGGKATDAFNEAIDKVYGKDRGWSHCPHIGASCDVGVGTTVRFSGVDPEFPRGLGEQIEHAEKHSDIWEVIEASGASPQAGDVVNDTRSGHHTYIVVQDEKGDFYRAESGLCSSFWHISGKFDGFESGARILRAKNAKNSSNGVNVENGVKSSSLTGTVTSGTGSGNMNIGASAKLFAWPEGQLEKRIKPDSKDAWYEMVKANLGHYPDDYVEEGASCVVYVWGVLRYAGLIDNFKISERLDEELEKSPDWTKVQDGKVTEDGLEDGDVLIHRCARNGSSNYPCHYGVYVKGDDGKGYTLQASNPSNANSSNKLYDYPWTTKGFKGDWQEAWRNSKNRHGDGCDVCDDGGGDMELKAGGMTLAEAKEFMKAYHDAAGKYGYNYGDVTFQGAFIHDAGCANGPMNNCVAFSQWFINKYTTLGPKWNNTTNGVDLVDSLVKSGLKRGTEPRPYAIFSKSGPTSDGHTGVILGVDKDAQKVVVGEAACSGNNPTAREYSFDDIKNWWYAYTDDVISMGGPLKSA